MQLQSFDFPLAPFESLGQAISGLESPLRGQFDLQIDDLHHSTN